MAVRKKAKKRATSLDSTPVDSARSKRGKEPVARMSGGRDTAARRQVDWPRLLGEATLIALVFVVPLIIHRTSRNMMDVKDFTLGVGVVVGLALVLFSSVARGSLSWASVRLNAFVGAYFAWAIGSVVYSHYRFATVSEGARLAAHVGLFWLVLLAVREMRQVRRIVFSAALAAVPMSIYAYLQAAGRDPVKWEVTTVRVFSFLGNATYLAGFLVLLIPLVVVVAWAPSETSRNGARARQVMGKLVRAGFFLGVAIMMVVALFLTVSLSPVIGVGLGVALATPLLLIRGGARAARIAVPAIAAGLILFVVFGYRFYQRLPADQQVRVQQVLHFQDPYSKERGLIQRVGMEIWQQQPVVGKAYGTYAVFALERLAPSWYSDLGHSTNTMLVPNYAHNEFIEVLAELGVVGELLFLAMIAAAYAAAVRVSLRHPEPEWAALGIAITIGMTAFLFQNLFGITFRQTGTVTFFWLSLGFLAVAQARMARADAAPQPAVREYRFSRPPLPALAVVGAGLAGLILLVTWLAKRPMDSNVFVKLAEREAKRGRLQTAAALADKGLELNPYSTVGYYLSAYAWGSLGDHERSLKANDKALEMLPGNASVYYNLGVNYKELGRLEEARDNLKRAIELMPTAMRHHAAMAEVLIQMGRNDEALPYAEEAVRLDPRNADAHLLLADVQARRGDLRATAAAMAQAAGLSPGDTTVMRQLADIYFRTRNYTEAANICFQWLKLEPEAPAAFMLLGAIHYNQKNYVAAEADYQHLLRLNPNDLASRLRLAYCQAQLKDYVAAQQQLEWLASMHPASPEGKAAAKTLQAGREAAARALAGGNGRPAVGR